MPTDRPASAGAAARDAGVRRHVEVLCTAGVPGPVTSGFVRPIILLPADADSWSDERRRVVLVHELAHIARSDYAAQLIATVACALLWFHPLVWLAAARMRAEAEHAADDRVLAAGIASIAYASHLLELARIETRLARSPVAAVGMVAASRLERRFAAILEPTRSRGAVSRRIRIAATSLTAAAMVPVAAVRTGVAPATRAPQPLVATVPCTQCPTSPTGVESPRRAVVHRMLPLLAAGALSMPAVAQRTARATAYPDFSGTWIVDSARTDVMLAGASELTVSITQTPNGMTIRSVTTVDANAVESIDSVAFDGSASRFTVLIRGARAQRASRTMTSRWEGATLVTTLTGDASGSKWERVERWSLGADSNTLNTVAMVSMGAADSSSVTTIRLVLKRR